MPTHLQEFFSSADDESRLVKLITESGFPKIPGLNRAFQDDELAIYIQEIDDPHHIAKGSGHQYGFILELYQPLSAFAPEHPLRKFFHQLQQPQVYGFYELQPKHKIEEYIQNS